MFDNLINLAKDAIASDDMNQILDALRIIGMALPETMTDTAITMWLARK